MVYSAGFMDGAETDTGALKRIEAINRSLRGFTLGLISLLPVIGIPFAVAALAQGRRATRLSGREWNPAGHYARAGSRLALLGLLSTFLFLVFVFGFAPLLWDQCGFGGSGST